MPELSPGDGQCLSGEVGWRGINLLGGEVVVIEDGDRLIPLDLCERSLSVSWVPRTHGVVGVIIGANMRSIAPWVCGLGTPYVPRRGAWVDRFGCWGAASLAGPRGIISREILLTREVFIGGGTPNRDRSPVNGTGSGCCASGCQIRTDHGLSSFESGDDIVDRERGSLNISSWDSPSSEESQSL